MKLILSFTIDATPQEIFEAQEHPERYVNELRKFQTSMMEQVTLIDGVIDQLKL